MKIRTMAWFAGTAFVAALGGIGAAACSSSGTGNPTLPTGTDSSAPTTDGPAASADGTVPPGMDTGVLPDPDAGGGDAGTPCAKPPTIGHAALGNGQYFCPFTAKQADGGFPTCKIGTDTCCITVPDGGPNTPSVCSTTACPAGEIPWQCDQTGDCAQGSICCLTAAALEPDLKCMGFQKAKQFKGTACVTGTACPAAAAGQTVLQACESDADCAGKKCTPIHASGAQIGVCL